MRCANCAAMTCAASGCSSRAIPRVCNSFLPAQRSLRVRLASDWRGYKDAFRLFRARRNAPTTMRRMASGAKIHLYWLDKTKGRSRAATWKARNKQRPVAIIAPTRTKGRLERDMALPQSESEASITLTGRVDGTRDGCYKVSFEAAA